MSDKETKERIEKEAIKYANKTYHRGLLWESKRSGYVSGATSERPKAWNEAIDACIETLITLPSDVYHKVRGRLEQLKHKQS